MKKTIKFVVCVSSAIVIMVAITMCSRFVGEAWAAGIVLALMTAELIVMFTSAKKEEKAGTPDNEIDTAVLVLFDYLEKNGKNVRPLSWPDFLIPEKDQPAMSDLPSKIRVLRNEEKALRSRINSYVHRRDSEEFAVMPDEKRIMILWQIEAMSLYHSILITRCIVEGVYIKKDDSAGNSSSSSSSDCPPSSSSSSSSDDSGSSSSDDGTWNGMKPAPMD